MLIRSSRSIAPEAAMASRLTSPLLCSWPRSSSKAPLFERLASHANTEKNGFQGLLLVRGVLQRLSPSAGLPHDCHATHAPQSRAGQPPTHWRKARVGACTLQPVRCTWDCAVAAVWPTALRLLAVDQRASVSTILDFFFAGERLD